MLREEIAQLFVFGFDGTSLPSDAQALLQQNAGGVILFGRNIEETHQLVSLITEIHSSHITADFPLISVDQEGGRVQRLKDICTWVPTMAEVGDAAHEDGSIPYRLGALMGRELATLGFHLDFTPVMDVNSNPDNPVIGERSFSHDPMWVAQCGAELIKGMQGAGVSACAKHFPGHGDTALDSHYALPVLHHTIDRLQKIEWPPFEAAIHAGVATIMTAHVLFPALDKDRPATLSSRILKEILIQKMKFQGLIFSDDLEMKALADHHSLEDMVYNGLCAGVDIFLICKDTKWTEEAISIAHRLVENGDVPVERVKQSLNKIAAWKQKYVGQAEPPNLEEIKAVVQCPPHLQWMSSWNSGPEPQQHRQYSPVDD